MFTTFLLILLALVLAPVVLFLLGVVLFFVVLAAVYLIGVISGLLNGESLKNALR